LASSCGFVKKSGGFGNLIVISKAVRCGPRYFGTPCDQVALLNALDNHSLSELKERAWLSPFDEGVARHKQRADVGGGGCLWHTYPNATLFGVLLCLPTAPWLPLWRNGDFGTSPIFGQLSDKPLLASIWLRGVSERKAQWRIEKLLANLIR
jgi:hypothetical protein